MLSHFITKPRRSDSHANVILSLHTPRNMIMSWHWNTCPINGRYVSGIQWSSVPHKGNVELWGLFCYYSEQAVELIVEMLLTWDAIAFIWDHCTANSRCNGFSLRCTGFRFINAKLRDYFWWRINTWCNVYGKRDFKYQNEVITALIPELWNLRWHASNKMKYHYAQRLKSSFL